MTTWEVERTALIAPFLFRAACLLVAGLTVAGCSYLPSRDEPEPDELAGIETAIQSLERTMAQSHLELMSLNADEDHRRELVTEHLEALQTDLEALPESVAEFCQAAVNADNLSCPDRMERVVITADKMLVGELEHVWVDPPGFSVVARIDTGATSSSLNADNLVQFERDGEDWVRFDLNVNESDPLTLERPIIRQVRVIQQADPTGSRRPVVTMRVRLGDVQDTFEFTLADRSHLQNDMILGRNFLTDVTLVDVGKQFIQPRFRPTEPSD